MFTYSDRYDQIVSVYICNLLSGVRQFQQNIINFEKQLIFLVSIKLMESTCDV